MNIYDRSVRTEDFLDYHIKLSKDRLKLNNSEALKEQQNNAKLLQDFLNTVAGFTPDNNNLIDSGVYESISDFLSKAKIKDFKNNAIVRGKKVSGTDFEKWMVNIINQSFKEAASIGLVSSKKDGIDLTKNQSITIHCFEKGRGARVLGKDQIDIRKNVTGIVDDEAKKILLEAYRNAKQKIDRSNKKSSIKKYWKPAVSGKIDIATNFAEVNINIEESNILSKILNLLQQTTFSLKGYISDSTVRIGQTNPYRVFLAVTSPGSAEEKSYRWDRMLNCIICSPEHESALKFYQLRYLYELTGYGAQYSHDLTNKLLGDQMGAEYIVYYREGIGIKVLSSSVIYNNLLKLIEADQLQVHGINEINNKEYALYSIMKLRFKAGERNKFSFELE